jgi:cellulose synthase/poly-beta-1,6-N-acetylglucosamine synthase-like glycosyltransferase
MPNPADLLLWLVAAPLLLSLTVLIVECVAACLPRRATRLESDRPPCAVLIPAHNEEAGIGQTLANLQPQLGATDRIVVVADNCSDRTAETARELGVEVVERFHAVHRGKGYALDHGLRSFDGDPPMVVVIIDADCEVTPGSIDRLVRTAAATGRPTQAAYVLSESSAAGPKAQLSALAFRVKNLIRPRGLDRLGLPCLLTGTGMAFPWDLIRNKSKLANGNIVEDMQLGIDLAVAGKAPRFCPDAEVTSALPRGEKAALTQRTRWEHGHLQTLGTQMPRLLCEALRQGRLDLLGLALELSVPPLSILGLGCTIGLAVLGLAAVFGASAAPAVTLAAAGAMFALALLTAVGRDLPFEALLAAPRYVLWKLPIYVAFIFKREKTWVRTERAA